MIGPRVALRPLSEDDIEAMAPWYGEAVATSMDMFPESVGRGPSLDRSRAGAPPYGTLEEARADPKASLLAIARRGDGMPIGVVAYRLDVPAGGWLTFEFVAVEPGSWGLGLDSEAVLLVEDDAIERGLAYRFWAGVSRDDGLGLYFWLRLGYRPARPGEGPWPGGRPHDTIAMIRVTENPEPRT